MSKKADIIGAVSLSRMMGGWFRSSHYYNHDHTRVDLVIELIEDDRVLWKYAVATNVPVYVDPLESDEPSMVDYTEEFDTAYLKALAGDEKIIAKGELVEMPA